MPFIYEPIPEADKQRTNFEKQAKDLSDFGNVSDEWLIDRERDIYLVCYATRSGHPENRPSQFGFGYKNLGFVELRVIEKVDLAEPYERIYEVLPIYWRGLEPHRDAILPLVEEAMKAFGLRNRPFSGVKSVRVIFAINA